MRPSITYCFLLAVAIYFPCCRKPYLPAAISKGNNYLVVDGVINTGTAAVTRINVNRTRNLTDSTMISIPELDARVTITANGGTVYPLSDSANNGIYSTAPLTLDSRPCKISVTTADNRKYESDFVSPLHTPPIDSIYWQQPGDLSIYLDTHDPSDNTHYYRWDYTETWEHHANYQTAYDVQNDTIYVVSLTSPRYRCWSNRNSTDILLGSSATLSQDQISKAPIITIPNNGDPRIGIEYSILVRQYALSENAYNYWQLIRKTSQNTGTLYDLQPTQLIGNIHCLTNPDEPVIGFITASEVQAKRILISRRELNAWQPYVFNEGCDTAYAPANPVDIRLYHYADTSYSLYYFSGGTMVLTKKFCLDCIYQGGSYLKPTYWP